jgi:hypothetical protein
MTVSVYIRESKTKKYIPLDPKRTYPVGTSYVLRYADPASGKWRWETLDRTLVLNASAAQVNAKLKEAELMRKALEARSTPSRPSLKDAAERYIETTRATKAKDSVQRYEYWLRQFLGVCTKQYLDDVKVSDLTAYEVRLKQRGMSARTVHNRIVNVVTFLRALGIKGVTIRVRYVEKKVRAYREDELRALFAAATPDEWLLFQFFLCSGAREQEVVHAEWDDIDLVNGLFAVRAKPDCVCVYVYIRVFISSSPALQQLCLHILAGLDCGRVILLLSRWDSRRAGEKYRSSTHAAVGRMPLWGWRGISKQGILCQRSH